MDFTHDGRGSSSLGPGSPFYLFFLPTNLPLSVSMRSGFASRAVTLTYDTGGNAIQTYCVTEATYKQNAITLCKIVHS